MKKCTNCKESKKLEEYNKNKSRKDGLNNICRICSKTRSKQYYKENPEIHKKNVRINSNRYRKEVQRKIFDYLCKHPCVDCGETNPVVLEFDHLRDKIDNVSTMIGAQRPPKLIFEEIAKCEIRCANCHRIKTAKIHGWFKLLLQE